MYRSVIFSLGSCSFCFLLQTLALVLVALAPVIALTLNRAVESLLAGRALLVLEGIAFGSRAITAKFEYGVSLVLR